MKRNEEATLKILERVDLGPLPIFMDEAKLISPLSRFWELKSAGLIEGALVRGDKSEIIKVKITGITHSGRTKLEQLRAERKATGPAAQALKGVGRFLWIAVAAFVGGLIAWLLKVAI